MSTRNSGVWFRYEDGLTGRGDKWVTDAASLVDTSNLKGCPCPACRVRSVTKVKLKPVKDSTGEITHWDGTCACRAKLRVFNDRY